MSLKRSLPLLAGALAAAALAAPARAQLPSITPFSLEVRGGAALPTGDFGELASTGWTAGITGQLNFTPMLGVYAGYSMSGFPVNDDFEGADKDLNMNDRGFNAGLRASFAPLAAGLAPWVKGGLVYNELEFEADGLSITTDSQLGFEVGGGLSFPLGPRISITPGVTYTSYSLTDDEDDDWDLPDLDVSYVKVDIGLNFRI
jgi:opacity protein-like surface antigen